MPITRRGESSNKNLNQDRIPVYDLRRLGNEKTVKTDMDVEIVPLVIFNSDNELNTVGETPVNHSMIDTVNYSYFILDEKDKSVFRSIRWADSGLRTDDDGIGDLSETLGLHLSEEERTAPPGINGASDGDKPAWEVVVTSYRIPVLWGVEYNDDGNVLQGSGEFAFLELNASQYNEMCKAFTPLWDAKKKIQFEEGEYSEKSFKFSDKGYGRALTFQKRPNAKALKDKNTWVLSEAVFSDIMMEGDIEDKYVEMIEQRDKWMRPGQYNVLYQQLMSGEIEASEDVCRDIVAAQARFFFTRVGEIAEGSDMDTKAILTLLDEIASKYTHEQTNTISNAFKSTKTVNVDGDEVDSKDADAPF